MKGSKLAVLLAALIAGACGEKLPASLKTDLGTVGNQEIARRFAAYKAKGQGCVATGDGPRVILTGFGLFESAPYNMSGVVVGSFAKAHGATGLISTRLLEEADDALSTVDSGTLQDEDYGGQLVNRSINIDGQNYSICFLKLDVLWDLAAAIIVHEASDFQPDLILMSGLGSDASTAFWEAGALNRARPLPGYDAAGAIAKTNRPEAPFAILPARSLGHETHLTWDNKKAQAAAEAIIASIPAPENEAFHSKAPAAARPDNDYICNNVSYLVNEAALGTPLALAGAYHGDPGKIQLQWQATQPVKVGFLHLPLLATADRQSVQLWIKAYAAAIRASLAAQGAAASAVASRDPTL